MLKVSKDLADVRHELGVKTSDCNHKAFELSKIQGLLSEAQKSNEILLKSLETANAEYNMEMLNRQHEIEILQKDIDMLKEEISNRCKDHNKKLQSVRSELIRFTNIVGTACHDEEAVFVDKTSSGSDSPTKRLPIPSGIGVAKSKSAEV